MLSFIMMCLGLGLMIWSLYSIRKDIETGNLQLTKGLSGVSDQNLGRIVKYLDDMEVQINGMNEAFYDLISDLEGSYSVHEKEISLMAERLQKIEKQMNMLTSEVRIETPAAALKNTKKVRAYQNPSDRTNDQFIGSTHSSVGETSSVANGAETLDKSSRDSMLGLSPPEAMAMKQKILELRKEGRNLSQIAKVLNVGIGELQLFIKLNTK